MITIAAPRSILKKVRPSYLLLSVAFVLLSIWLAFELPSSLTHPQGLTFLDKWNQSFSFAASVKNAAILVRTTRADNMQLLLIDFDSGKRTRLKSEGSHLLSPYLSPDGTRLLFSRQPLDRPGHELVSCSTSGLTCHVILRSAGSIHSGIEISGGWILFVSSPYVTVGDGRVRVNRNDIWIFDPTTRPRQLIDFRLYQLRSLSVTQNHVYFSAYGPSRDRPVIPKFEPLSSQQSSIFRLPFDPEKATIDPPSETLTPLFASAGIADYPTASADGSLVAFLRTRTGISPYHYNLVIADQNSHSELLVESPGLGSSRPVVIDHDVYTSVTEQDRLLVQVKRQGEGSMKLLADIDDTSIAGAEAVELRIEP